MYGDIRYDANRMESYDQRCEQCLIRGFEISHVAGERRRESPFY